MLYDFTFLLGDEKETKTVKDLITAHAGKITKEEEWGKKELSYPIKKATSAFYYTYNLEMEEKKVTELKRKLDFDEKLLRYLLLKKK